MFWADPDAEQVGGDDGHAGLRGLDIGLPEVVCLRLLDMSPGRSSADLARAIRPLERRRDRLLAARLRHPDTRVRVSLPGKTGG